MKKCSLYWTFIDCFILFTDEKVKCLAPTHESDNIFWIVIQVTEIHFLIVSFTTDSSKVIIINMTVL